MQTTFVKNPAISIGVSSSGEFVYVHLGTAEIVLDYSPIDSQIHTIHQRNQQASKTDILQALAQVTTSNLVSRFEEMVDAYLYIQPTPGINIQYPPDIYYSMMVNTDRVYPYLIALSKCVNNNSLVVELGAGLGIFALYAAKLGADVIALEPGRVIDICRKIAIKNNLDSKIRFIQGVVRNLRLDDRKADVVVSEFIGESFLDEQIIQHGIYTRKHILKPGGRIIPSSLHIYLQGVQSDEARRCISIQNEEILKVGKNIGFDLTDLQNLVPWHHQNRLIEHSRNSKDLTHYQDAIGITSEQLLTSIDFNNNLDGSSVPKEGLVTLTVTDDGFIDAFYFYFSAALDSEITLTNSLADRDLFSWPHRFLPAGAKRRFYRAGDTLKVAWKFLDYFSTSDFRFIASIID